MKISCTGCGKQYRIEEQAAGKKFKCPACGQLIESNTSANTSAPRSVSPAQSARKQATVKQTVATQSKTARQSGRVPPPIVGKGSLRGPGKKAKSTPEARLMEILKGFEGEFPRPRMSLAHQFVALLVLCVMLILPLIYLGFVGLIGYATYWHVTHNVSWMTDVPGVRIKVALAIAYALLAIAGLLWFLSLIRPLFLKMQQHDNEEGLDRDDEPVLFEFCDQLADIVGCPRPDRIFLSLDANASASYNTKLFGLKRESFTLTLGIPLIAGMTVQQLAGIIAHEFGHFGQSASTLLERTIQRISAWFYLAVFGEDAIDEFIGSLTGGPEPNPILMLFGGLLWLLVGLGRLVLLLLFFLSQAVSSTLLRRMEFNADQFEIGIVGSKGFEESSRRLVEINIAHEIAWRDLFDRTSGMHLPRDYPAYVAEISKQDQKIVRKANKLIKKEKGSLFRSHPTTRARIKFAARLNRPGIFHSKLDGKTMFKKFGERSRHLTHMLYMLRYGPNFNPDSLRPVSEAVEAYMSTRGARANSA